MPETSTDTSLLDLLRMGARISFPGGQYLQGGPGTRYIHVGTQFGPEGLWSMDEKGLRDALADLRKMARDDGYTLEGNPLPADDETSRPTAGRI